MTKERLDKLSTLHESRGGEWDVELYKKTLMESFAVSEEEAMADLREFGAIQTKKLLEGVCDLD